MPIPSVYPALEQGVFLTIGMRSDSSITDVPTDAAAREEMDVAPRQKYLGAKGLIAFLALLSAFIPLSTDLYLPALPSMTRYFGAPEYLVNLTLILFFVFYALATMMWGPFSDRYGRRRILIIGLSGYTVASALCAISFDVYQLIFFRILQAVGAGAASAVATAIVRDSYRGRKREKTLAIVQSLVLISPAVAPIIGALLLTLTSWRGAFVAQSVLGVVAVAGAVAFQETLGTKGTGNVVRTLGRLGVVLKNRVFTLLLIVFALVSIASMSFVSSSAYIYQETFGQSSRAYSYYFALNALAYLSGPLLYLRLSVRFKRVSIVSACFVMMVVSGVLVSVLGHAAPWAFAITLFPASMAVSGLRPPGVYLMLDQVKDDAGSASALMSSSQLIMGSAGMLVVSFQFLDRVLLIGIINVVFGLLAGAVWLGLVRPGGLSRAGSGAGGGQR